MSRDLVLASNNAHKVVEIARVLEPRGFRVRPLRDFPEIPDPPETGATFEDNALQKARFVHERTGLPCLADDSGLEVDALGGGPGVHSKRFTPEATDAANNARLIRELRGRADRGARYVCALAFVDAGRERVLRGTCEGEIAHDPRGTNGFGYDPYFLPREAPGFTMAELQPAEKDAISHRGRALARIEELLR